MAPNPGPADGYSGQAFGGRYLILPSTDKQPKTRGASDWLRSCVAVCNRVESKLGISNPTLLFLHYCRHDPALKCNYSCLTLSSLCLLLNICWDLLRIRSLESTSLCTMLEARPWASDPTSLSSRVQNTVVKGGSPEPCRPGPNPSSAATSWLILSYWPWVPISQNCCKDGYSYLFQIVLHDDPVM